jgi:cytochrome c-type biogenesis protein
MEVSLLAAFVAGTISFLSPCVLPLVPGYISMLSGIGVEQLQQGEQPRARLFASSLAFVSGFSVVFITFGASASAVGQFLVRNRSVTTPFAGAVVILFGLHLVGWLVRIPVRAGAIVGAVLAAAGIALWIHPLTAEPGAIGPAELVASSLIFLAGPSLTRFLNRDLHFRNLGGQQADRPDKGPFATSLSGFLLGFAFAFGWTPCIGPILTAVLTMAASTETISRGVFLLAVYSAGLAIPFLLTALAINRFLRFYKRFRRHLHAVEVGSGVLLLFVGFLIFTNSLTWLSGKLDFLNRFVL